MEARPVARARLQDKLRQIEAAMCGAPPTCTGCGGGMKNRGRKRSSFVTRFGTMELRPVTYLCAACRRQVRPALERPRGEAGHLSGCLARLLALLAIVVPYAMAAQLACHFFGIDVSAMAVWRAVQRLRASVDNYVEAQARYYANPHREAQACRDRLWRS